jgi:NAD(P)-dependent dehydrogenase (short-subunit alcohol dehydrogenase family)
VRIFVIGASGTIGSAVTEELKPRHEVITGGRHSGDVRLDVHDSASIRAAFEELRSVDAVVSATGAVKFGPFEELEAADYVMSLRNKLLCQVNLVLIGRDYVSERGSFTLTSGVLDVDPIVGGTAASMANGAINAFVLAASIEMPSGQRINAVSPGVIEESMGHYGPFFRGFEPVPARRAALAYSKSVEGARTGHVFRVA